MADFEAPQLREQLAAMREILRAIGRMPKQTEALCELILNSARRLAGCQLGVVALHEGQRWFRCMAITGVDRDVARPWLGAHYQVPASLMRDVGPWRPLQLSQAQLRDSVQNLPPIFEFFVTHVQWQWVLMVPLLAGDEMVGSFVITKTDAGPFSAEQFELVQSFADHAVVALQNARVLTALDRQNALQSANTEILAAISASRSDASPIFDIILRKSVEFTRTDVAGLGLHEGDGRMRFMGGIPVDWTIGGLVGMIYRVDPEVLRRGDRWVTHYDGDIQTSLKGQRRQAIHEFLMAKGIRTVLTIPLVSEGRLIGVFHACSKEVRTFTDEQLAMVGTFASQVVIALENARTFHEVELKNEQLEQASRHKSEFLANMSHELRTPLNAIIGFSEALKDELFGPLNDKQAEYARDIHGAGHHLLTLINDVLDLAKVEAGRMELMVEPFDLPEAIDSALIMVRERANRHGVALDAQLDAALGRFVGDERKFKQVLLNLLSNGVKFSPDGGQVNVHAEATAEGVRVSVSDQGIGIPEHQQRLIFEAFHQAESTLAVKREGTGLGLTLARRFVELHGGAISVHSQPGEGSTFTFSMTSQPWPAD